MSPVPASPGIAVSQWTQLGQDIDGEAASDDSGYSVALSADGSVMAIGARSNSDYSTFSGQVRLYGWDSVAGSWTQLLTDIDGKAAYEYSGYSVAISADGSRVAIGAPYNEGDGTYPGHVRVYSTEIFEDGFESAMPWPGPRSFSNRHGCRMGRTNASSEVSRVG